MLITIADYCEKRNVSKQFVYEYIKKGKLKVLELPTFVELHGERVTLGMQKMLDVPESLVPKPKDKRPLPPLDSTPNLANFIEDITDDAFLSDFYHKYLTIEGKEAKKAMKAQFYADIDALPNSVQLREAIDEANLKLMQHMRKLGSQVQEVLDNNVATRQQKQLIA
jgi:hypothetical protein